ncbi:hypothetical protein GpartN1_g6693.t1 [Galdieria partita]|uniref:Inositol 2-dehydrogenase n=1 Tax=Galdieria partita TaxID=83374 RepID=A0A9C7UTR4_9RHOD|nr:hypothetical protein GpartN1_g6693.t1 [Galdieria partita]
MAFTSLVDSQPTWQGKSLSKKITSSWCKPVVRHRRFTTIQWNMRVASSVNAAETSLGEKSEETVGIGIIGAGRIGQVHAENLAFRIKKGRLVGVASGTKQLAERCSLATGCKPYYDYHLLLEDPSVDAVCICSASNQHTKQIIEAARAGKHIFCEKPIDTDLKKIDEALKVVEECGVQLQVGFNRRFDQNYSRVRQAIVRGEIGTPQILHIVSRDPSPPPLDYLKSSGGIWLDCSIHDFDMARFLIGDEVEQVYAVGAIHCVPEMKEFGDVDTSIVLLQFRNGVVGTIDNSRQAVYGYDQRCEVFGSKGSVHINNNYPNSAVISTNQSIMRDLPLHFFMERYTESFIEELDQFCDCILNKKPVPVTGWDGRAPVVIALAAKKSYMEGRPIRVEQVDYLHSATSL